MCKIVISMDQISNATNQARETIQSLNNGYNVDIDSYQPLIVATNQGLVLRQYYSVVVNELALKTHNSVDICLGPESKRNV